MALQFHETVRGARFFDHQLPQLIKALNRVADEMEMVRKLEEKKLELSKESIKGDANDE